MGKQINNINPKNSKKESHGYQEWYTYSRKLWLRGIYKNHLKSGYIEENSVFGNSIGEKGTIVKFHII